MEQLQAAGSFQPPSVRSMEQVLETGLQMKQGRVFMDLWDAEQFCPCPECARDRLRRLEIMNKTQQVPEPARCSRSGCG
jgi:hypothetical protein